MTISSMRSVLITGGTGGLGRAVVQRLLDEYDCVVLYRSETAWQTLQRELQHPRLRGLPADLDDAAAVERAIEQAAPLWGLVHLAGGFQGGTLEQTTPELWQRMLATNLTAAFTAIRALLPQLRQQGAGRIITIGSAAAMSRPAGLVAYNVSKAALQALTESVAHELKGTPITANVLLPGSLDTPAMHQFEQPERLVPLAHVAETIAFLLSDAGAGISGAAIALTITGVNA